MARKNSVTHEECRTQLNEQLEAYRQIATDVAHDLNNLLLLISGYSEILAKNLDNRQQVLEVVENIQAATLSVKELTAKLQSIAQVDEGATSEDVSPTEETTVSNTVLRNKVRIGIYVGNEGLRQLVAHVLKRFGFVLTEIDNGIATNTPENFFGDSFDILIFDTESELDGGKFALELIGQFPRVPLLQLTDSQNEVSVLATGRDFSTLSRSFRPSELVDAVNRLLA